MTARPAVDRLAALALSGAAVAAPALALHAHRAMAPILSVAAILAVAGTLAARRRLPPFDHTLAALFAAAMAWSAVTLLWPVAEGGGLGLVVRVGLVLAGSLALVGAARGLGPADTGMVRACLLAGIAIGAALQAFEAATGGALKGLLSDRDAPIIAIKAGSTVLVVLVWIAIAGAADQRRPGLAWLLAAAIAVPLPFMDGRAAAIAYVVGAGAFGLGWIAPRATAAVLAGGSAVAILAAPLAARDLLPRLFGGIDGGVLPFTAAHRIEIWRFAGARILERPLLGWGFDTARAFPGADRVLDPATGATQMPLHPHNVGLQWWLELGLVGAIIGALTIAAIAGAAARRPTAAGRAGALAALAAALVVSKLSYGAWQSWWLAGLGLAAAFAALGPPARHTDS